MTSTTTPTVQQAIARLARDVRTPTNKAEAFNALRRIIDSQDWGTIDSRGEALQDLARLYAHFLPKAPSKAATAFDWCAKAIGKGDKRDYLNYVYVTFEHIVGTDGHSLHVAPNAEGLEPGYYNTAGDHLYPTTWQQYPDYKRVVPPATRKGAEWRSYARQDLEMVTRSQKDGKVGNAYLVPATYDAGPYKPDPIAIASHLVDRLYSMNKDDVLSFNVLGRLDSVLVTLDADRFAVLMPLR